LPVAPAGTEFARNTEYWRVEAMLSADPIPADVTTTTASLGGVPAAPTQIVGCSSTPYPG
jgi:hypothetical protein